MILTLTLILSHHVLLSPAVEINSTVSDEDDVNHLPTDNEDEGSQTPDR